MQRPLGAQISHMLKDRGVTHIFGIPGVHNQEMYRGIEEAGLTHVLVRHEQGAGFMADGYARATGKPGVCYVITGPGLCNVMTPLGQAYSDSVPILCLASCLDETAAQKGQLHQMRDQEGAGRAVCDWSETAHTAKAAYQLIDRALWEFQAQRARPKAIHVPIAQLEMMAEPPVNWRPEATERRSAQFQITRLPGPVTGEPPLDMIDHLALRLLHAERPLFVFGGGATYCGAQSAPIETLLRLSRAATFTTYAGRGIVPDSWDLSFGSYLARPDSAKIFEASDCVVFWGTDLAEVDLWRAHAGHQPGAIHINLDATVLASTHPRDMCLQQDTAEVMFKLLASLERHAPNLKSTPKSGWSPDIVAGYRDTWRAQVATERPGIVPVCDALADVMGPDMMVYSDMTQFAYAAKEVIPMARPGHWHHPYGFGTLGYALPAAIGGAIARPGLPTLAILGDYGFQYTMMELATAVELELPLPVILWDNGKLGEIEDSMVRAQIAPNAVIQKNPDFLKLAEAFGAHACAPRSLPEFQEMLRTALNADRPTVIHLTPEIAS